MQKFTILGITLYDYGAREALRNTDRFLGSGGLNTVAYISSAQIARASRDEELHLHRLRTNADTLLLYHFSAHLKRDFLQKYPCTRQREADRSFSAVYQACITAHNVRGRRRKFLRLPLLF